MADIAEFKLGDTGFTIIGTIIENGDAVDISAATGLTFYFRNPEGTITSQSGSLYTDGTDGKMKYTATSTFLPIADRGLCGVWSFECKATIGTWTGTSASAQFRVADVLRRT